MRYGENHQKHYCFLLYKNKNDKQKQEFSLTFTVITDTDGNVEKVNAPFDLTEDFYTDKINDIIYGSEDKGQIRSSNGYWSYKVVPLDTGFIIAFTECQAEHAMLRNLFLILLLVGVVALTVAFFNQSVVRKPFNQAG